MLTYIHDTIVTSRGGDGRGGGGDAAGDASAVAAVDREVDGKDRIDGPRSAGCQASNTYPTHVCRL